MANSSGSDVSAARHSGPPRIRQLQFDDDTSFQKELQRRVDEYFQSTGRLRRDPWQMYFKTAVILACFVSTYVLLVFIVKTVWLGLLLAAALGLCMAAIGFNIQHDGGHNSYSSRRWVNRLMAWTLDMVGSSSWRWHWKHTVIHHRYVNISGYDGDIDTGFLARFTPHQPRRWYHRWQHIYLWPVYGLLAVKMQFLDDFRYIIMGRLGENRVPRPTGWELVIFVVGKLFFLTWLFVIPMLLHPIWLVLLMYGAASVVLSIAMVLVFIIPHLEEKAEFPLPNSQTGRMDIPWAVHEARVTVNFARKNRILTWLLGGLNYHKEHHLFPVICHVNYPGISKVVEQTCLDFGVPYHTYGSFFQGVAAHYRWLRRMGKGD